VAELRRTPVDFGGKKIGPSRTRVVDRPLVLPNRPTGRTDLEPMPDGADIRALVDWVGYDPQRVKAAVVAELDRDPVRTEVIDELSSLPTHPGAHS
jgi:hypothetical protein